MFKVKAQVKEVAETVVRSENFSTQDVVLERSKEDEKYAPYIKAQLINDKCDSLYVGEVVEATLNVTGRENNGKYYNNVTITHFEKL